MLPAMSLLRAKWLRFQLSRVLRAPKLDAWAVRRIAVKLSHASPDTAIPTLRNILLDASRPDDIRAAAAYGLAGCNSIPDHACTVAAVRCGAVTYVEVQTYLRRVPTADLASWLTVAEILQMAGHCTMPSAATLASEILLLAEDSALRDGRDCLLDAYDSLKYTHSTHHGDYIAALCSSILKISEVTVAKRVVSVDYARLLSQPGVYELIEAVILKHHKEIDHRQTATLLDKLLKGKVGRPVWVLEQIACNAQADSARRLLERTPDALLLAWGRQYGLSQRHREMVYLLATRTMHAHLGGRQYFSDLADSFPDLEACAQLKRLFLEESDDSTAKLVALRDLGKRQRQEDVHIFVTALSHRRDDIRKLAAEILVAKQWLPACEDDAVMFFLAGGSSNTPDISESNVSVLLDLFEKEGVNGRDGRLRQLMLSTRSSRCITRLVDAVSTSPKHETCKWLYESLEKMLRDGYALSVEESLAIMKLPQVHLESIVSYAASSTEGQNWHESELEPSAFPDSIQYFAVTTLKKAGLDVPLEQPEVVNERQVTLG